MAVAFSPATLAMVAMAAVAMAAAAAAMAVSKAHPTISSGTGVVRTKAFLRGMESGTLVYLLN